MSARASILASLARFSASKLPIWRVDTAYRLTALPPMIHRMAGSRPRRQRHLRPHNRQDDQTPIDEIGPSCCDICSPVRLSMKISPATSVRPEASSSSQHVSYTVSEINLGPWDSSFRRRSKSTRKLSCFDSPIGCLMLDAPSMYRYFDSYGRIPSTGVKYWVHLGSRGLKSKIIVQTLF